MRQTYSDADEIRRFPLRLFDKQFVQTRRGGHCFAGTISFSAPRPRRPRNAVFVGSDGEVLVEECSAHGGLHQQEANKPGKRREQQHQKRNCKTGRSCT